ncbi:MAG: SPOR domain-containing protein [Rhodovulum sulfidophilum]|uniref:SPOR domain-containing protein n=1 Tax=Rhodovulum sulfidophilum TaxID=35806 RepID=A0A2W5N7J0_RHOSU|nr:MAG: SPOR domain-containing protein [Rhodovulum sulfidophilum]
MRRIGGAVLFLGVIAAMGLWSYRLGTRDANEVPVIKAMAGPARLAPEDPGGLTAAHQGLEVNSVLAGQAPAAPGGGAVAAPAAPALSDEDAAEGDLVIAGQPIPAAQDAAPGIAGPAPAEAAPVSIQNELAAMVAALGPAEAATPPDGGDGMAATAPPRGRPSNLTLARASVPAAAAVAPTPTPAPAKPAAREAAATPASGTRMVQLGAYDSETLARDAWSRMVAKDGDLLGSKSLYVERATSNARVFYRLRVAGFETSDDTRRMCEALRGRGIDCIPVTLN